MNPCSMIWLSVQKWVVVELLSGLSSVDTKLHNLAAVRAIINSNLGKVKCLSGATLDLAITRDPSIMPA